MLTDLKAARLRKGLTQLQVDEITGINRTSVSSIQQRRLVPNVIKRQALAELLGGSEADFFDQKTGLAL